MASAAPLGAANVISLDASQPDTIAEQTLADGQVWRRRVLADGEIEQDAAAVVEGETLIGERGTGDVVAEMYSSSARFSLARASTADNPGKFSKGVGCGPGGNSL